LRFTDRTQEKGQLNHVVFEQNLNTTIYTAQLALVRYSNAYGDPTFARTLTINDLSSIHVGQQY
jgi:hypothetical protein